MKSFLKRLVETPAPSGYERPVRDLVRAEIETLVDELTVDQMGNLIARKGQPEAAGLKMMLIAHLDEAGLAATHIDEQGFVRFLPIGQLTPINCLGSRVQFLNGAQGIICAEQLADENKRLTFDRLFIDLGLSSRADCSLRIGDQAVLLQPFGDHGERVTGKALDNRAGVAVLVETLRQMHTRQFHSPHELYFVFSVQGQVGARGAITAAYAINPDLGLAIAATPSADAPGGRKPGVRLRQGPAIRVRDESTIFDPAIVDWMVRTAEATDIPFQMEVVEKEYTGGRAIQLSRCGVPVGCLSLPCRYMHSALEMMDCQDLQNGTRLLIELLGRPFNAGRSSLL